MIRNYWIKNYFCTLCRKKQSRANCYKDQNSLTKASGNDKRDQQLLSIEGLQAIPSRVISDKLDILLQHHPDTKMVLEPLTGFMEGFMTGTEGAPIKSTICRNLQFTHKEQNGFAVTELLTKEVDKGVL